MKKYYLGILICLYSTITYSQIDLVITDLPFPDTAQPVAFDNSPDGIAIGTSSSQAQVFNFTSLSADSYDVVEYTSPADTPWGDNYPLADMARTDDLTRLLGISLGNLLPGGGGAGNLIGTAYYGLNFATGRLYTVGLVTDLNLGFIQMNDLTFNAQPPDVLTAALDYGQSLDNTGVFNVNISVFGFTIPATLTVEKNITADAYGTLQLPHDTIEVLRHHETSNISFDIDFDLIPIPIPDTVITVHTYRYIAKEKGYPMAIVNGTSTETGFAPTSVEFIDDAQPAVLGFSANSNCMTVQTNNSSQFAIDFQWNFGDGSPVVNQYQPEHTYTEEGEYIITLTANGLDGTSHSITNTVTVSCQATAFFFPNSTCRTATFNNLSQNGNTYLWNFGDGQTSTEQSPEHTYAADGSYNVSLIATSISGHSDTTYNAINIDCTLSADFSVNSITCLEASFESNGQNVASYTWNFGDGSPTSSEPSPTHAYGAPGTYSVTLAVTGLNGEVQQLSGEVTVSYCVNTTSPDIEDAYRIVADKTALYLQMPPTNSPTEIVLYSLSGNIVYQLAIVPQTQMSLPLPQLPIGLYIAALYQNGISAPAHREKILIR